MMYFKLLTSAAFAGSALAAVVLPRDPPAPTAAPTLKCDAKWCQNGTELCAYWAGVTGWDVSLGPIPGEVVTSVGTCAPGVLPRQAPAVTTTSVAPTSTFTIKCDYRFCAEGTSLCIYWGGITAYDPISGPIPGETHTTLGLCSTATATTTATP